MSDYAELIKALRDCAEINSLSLHKRGLMKQAADALEELSRREAPMRVRITASTKRCPSCNKQVSGIGNIHRNYRYCRWCGQALDWTEPPKEE